MSLAMLVISDWGASSTRDVRVQNPIWSQVEAAIRALNNSNLNDIYLLPNQNDSDTYLAIGGGAGNYILTGSVQNNSFPTFVDSTRPANPHLPLVVGGQSGEYPANWITDLPTALSVAKAFFESGSFDCGIHWVAV